MKKFNEENIPKVLYVNRDMFDYLNAKSSLGDLSGLREGQEIGIYDLREKVTVKFETQPLPVPNANQASTPLSNP